MRAMRVATQGALRKVEGSEGIIARVSSAGWPHAPALIRRRRRRRRLARRPRGRAARPAPQPGEAARPPSRTMAARRLVLRDAMLRMAPQDEATERYDVVS